MLLNERLKRKDNITLLTAVGFCFVATWAIFFYLSAIKDGKWFDCRDLKGHRAIVGYALSGKDPYLYIGKDAVSDFIGKIPPKFSTVPWALVFGAVFYPGYLPLTASKIYLILFQTVFLALGIYLINKKCNDKKNIFIIAFCAVSHFSFMYSMYFGNCGGAVSLMIICALLLVDDRPVIAGIIMGFALMKPQISAIFCIVWLLDKKIKPLVSAGVVCVAGWAVSSAVTGVNPLTLLKEMSEASTSSDEQYLGILSSLKFLGVDSMVVLGLNVAAGVLFTVIFTLKLKKSGAADKNIFLKYTPAAVASCFWIYKNGTDFLILLIAVIALTEILEYCNKAEFRLYLLFIMFLEISRGAVSTASSFMFSDVFLRDVLKSAEGLALMIVCIIICSTSIEIYKRNKLI